MHSTNFSNNTNATNFNQNITNHTPTFTHPANVTVPTNKSAVGGSFLNKQSGTTNSSNSTNLNNTKTNNTNINTTNINNTKVNASQFTNSHATGAHVSNPQITNLHNTYPVTTNSLGKSQIQTFHKTVGGPFQGHTIQGNQMLLHTNQGQVHALNAHVYNKTYFGNQAIHLAPMGYHPSYLQHSAFYHGPWSGNSWGWGWGLGAGFGFGFGGLGWGIGIGSGWGYGGFGYGGYGGGYGLYGPYGYWGRPLGWGFGGWGLGTLCYNSGYYPYYNPYYYPPGNQNSVYNYSNPLPVATNVGVDPNAANVANVAAISNSDAPPPIPQANDPDFDAARAAFRDGNYPAALAAVDAAIGKTNTDAVLHEFRALVLFAMQDYKQAAGVIHSLLAVGPGWDWTTMSGMYADPDTYTQQLRALEQNVLANPKAADAHFLLAYHYTTIGHSEAAANQLQQVVKLMPTDRLAGELLKMVQGPPAQVQPATPPGPGIDATTGIGVRRRSATRPHRQNSLARRVEGLPSRWFELRPEADRRWQIHLEVFASQTKGRGIRRHVLGRRPGPHSSA